MADKQSEDSGEKRSNNISALEWLVGVVGIILVVGTIGFMVYKALTSENTPPDFTTKIVRIDTLNSGYLVVFKLKNTGEQTAAGVNAVGELTEGGESVETSNITFDYAPSKSDVEGGLFFKNDPQQFQLKIRVNGYTKP